MVGSERRESPQVILVLEASVWRAQLEELLAEVNIHLQTADNAEQALQLLDPVHPPDVLIADLFLPDINGIRLSHLLREENYQPFNAVPILILSSLPLDLEAEISEHNIHSNTYMIPRSEPGEVRNTVLQLIQNNAPFHRRSLIVDDSATARLIAKTTLEKEGCIVDTASSSQEAQSAFKTHLYSTAVLDFHLPDQNGDELLKQLQAQQPDCVFLMMTSNPDPALASRLMRLGASGYLQKPFSPDYLRHLFRRAHAEKIQIETEKLLLQTNRKLLEYQEQLQAVLSALPDLIFQLDKDGIYLNYHANNAEYLFDHPDEFLGKRMADILPADVAESFDTCILKALDSGTLQSHEYSLEYDQEVRHFEARITPCRDNEVLAVVRDITERKRTQQALEESESRLRTLARNVPGAVFQLDVSPDGIPEVAYSNEKIEPLLGLKQTDHSRQLYPLFLEASHPEDRMRLEDSIRAAILDKKPWDYEGRFIHPEKGVIWLRGLSNPRTSDGSLTFEGILLDITSHMEANAALQESELKFRTLVNQAVEMLYLHDLEGNLVDVNEAAVHTTGYSRQELLHMNVQDLDPGSSEREDDSTIWQQLTPESPPVTIQVEHRRKDGSTYPAEVTIARIDLQDGEFIFALARDISEQKGAEAALRHSEQKYRSLTDTTIDWVFQVDAQGRFTYASPNITEIMGYTVEEVLGKTPIDFMIPEEANKIGQILSDAVNRRDQLLALEETLLHKDGHPIHFETNAVPLFDNNGELTGYFGTCRDITSRKEAERALMKREQELQHAQRVAHIGSWQFDLNSGMALASLEAQRIYGLRDQEFPIKEAQGIPLPEYRPKLDNAISGLVQGERSYDVQFRIQRQTDGAVRHIHSMAEYDSERNQVIGTIQDITERVLAQQALLSSEEQYRRLVQKSLQGVIISQQDPMRLVFASQPMEEILGYSPDELTSMDEHQLIKLVHEDIREEYFKNFRLRIGGKPIPPRNEYRLIHKDGTVRWVEIYSTRIEYKGEPAVQTAFMDITDHKTMQAQLKQTNETLNALIKSSPSAIIALDLQGRVTLWNPAAEKIFGFAEEEVLGKQNPIVPIEDTDFFATKLELLQKGSEFRMEVTRKTKSGDMRDVWLSTAPLPDASGDIVGVIDVFEDITARKQAEREKARLEEDYRQAQRVEAVGRLAGGIAHDLNNLLTPILLHAEMLQEEFEPGCQSIQSVQEIYEAGTRAKDLVRQLLAFSRKQNLEYKPVLLNTVIKQFGMLLQRTIREDIQIEFRLKPMDHTIFADIGQIEQVIMNLAVNAQDAMPDGGHLTIQTDLVSLHEELTDPYPDLDPGDHVVLSIHDTGIGMDEKTRERIFEPFYSTKGNKGTGLGLSTVYGIIKQHSGHIQVESAPGEGSVFKIFFPAVFGIKPEYPTKRTVMEDLAGSETILLVEDNDQVRDLTLSILLKSGYQVLTAENGAEGLRILQTHENIIQLLLTDIVMPEMNGRELYLQARKTNPQLKVLYMTGYSNDVIAHSGVLEPGVPYLQKPYTIQELKLKVRDVLSGKSPS